MLNEKKHKKTKKNLLKDKYIYADLKQFNKKIKI